MTKRVRPSPAACWASLQIAARALGEAGQPAPIFEAVHHALDKLVGAKLFTILTILPDGSVERLYTNDAVNYPLLGRKPKNVTRWSTEVIDAKRHFLGRTYAEISEVFFDHVLIRSLGCESCVNVLCVHDDRVVGSVNMLHEANWYDTEDLAIAEPFVRLLVPALTMAR
jgi:hypothetical protein